MKRSIVFVALAMLMATAITTEVVATGEAAAYLPASGLAVVSAAYDADIAKSIEHENINAFCADSRADLSGGSGIIPVSVQNRAGGSLYQYVTASRGSYWRDRRTLHNYASLVRYDESYSPHRGHAPAAMTSLLDVGHLWPCS